MSDQPSSQNPPPAPPTAGFTPPPPPANAGGEAPSAPLQPATTTSGPSVSFSPAFALSVLGIAGVIVGLLVKFTPPGSSSVTVGETTVSAPKENLWDTMSWLWAILAIIAVVATLLPALGPALNLAKGTVRTFATIAAGILGLWWVVFVLPRIEWTGGFFVTAGVALALGAVYLSTKQSDA